MSSLNLLRGGFRTLNVLTRPHSTLQSSLMGRAAVLSKKNSLLFTNSNSQQAIVQQLSRPTLINQFVRTSVHNTPLVRDEKAGQHWAVERYLATGLLAIIPASLMLETAVTDYLLAAALTLHAYWGCHSIVIDYIHGPTMPKIASSLLIAITALSFIGLCYFNYTDIGLASAIKKIWSL